MKKLVVSIAVGAAALLGSSAQAADSLATTESYADETPVVENVRTNCDEFGRCWQERRRNPVIIERDSYNYMPRERYIEPRHHGDDHERSAAGIGIDATGASVGVGGDRW